MVSRLRITPWPRVPLQLPDPANVHADAYVHGVKPEKSLEELNRLESELSASEFDELLNRLDIAEYDEPDALDLPLGEAYLELYELDLTDLQQIRSFVQRWSILGFFYPKWAGTWNEGYFGFHNIAEFTSLTKELLGKLDPSRVEFRASLPPIDENWVEFQVGALCIKDMVTAWRVVSGEISESSAKWVTPCWTEAECPIDFELDIPTTKAIPELILETGMWTALTPFAPRLIAVESDEPIDTDSLYGNMIPLYSVCCAELFNHMIEGATYRECENTTCGRFFVRQRGRAAHGQHRMKGVKYCSAECARAQSQRAYRRRKSESG